MIKVEQQLDINRNDNNTYKMSPALMKTINKIIQSEGYLTYSLRIKDISTEGENYMSSLKEVDIKGNSYKVNKYKETNLFIKQSLPETDKVVIPAKKLFLKEIFIYTELAKLFVELQDEFNVPDEEKYSFVKLYHGNEDSLIFDNMSKKGFKTYNRFDVMPLKAMELSIKQIAKFHALSVVSKQFKPDFYRNKIQTKEHPFAFDNNGENFITSICQISLKYLEGDRKSRVEKYIQDLSKKSYRFLVKNGGKIKCLCHGDYRMNNILVKEMNGEATAVLPIDYQAAYYNSPITDIIYLIFVSTDRQFRKKYMEGMMETYFDSFTKFLQYFNVDAETVYTREEFESEFKNHLEYALTVTFIILPFVLAAEDDLPELKSDVRTIKMHDCYKPRLEEIIDDFIEWGYL